MSLQSLSITDFRCIADETIDLGGDSVLITGANGAGKTSFLEAIYCLSRGRSFRASRVERLVRESKSKFVLFAVCQADGPAKQVGLSAGRGHREIRINREAVSTLAELAGILSVEVIDPEVHALIAEGPEVRRRFLDYGVFHVEQDFMNAWRRYKRALQQRNQALRQSVPWEQIKPWTEQLVEAAEHITDLRKRQIDRLSEKVEKFGKQLLPGYGVKLKYRQGWDKGLNFADATEQSRQSDQEMGLTHRGPHRADLIIDFEGSRARQRVSRGQQKLVAAALVLSQTEILQEVSGKRPLLLIDDPIAELDQDSLGRLVGAIQTLECQVIATALEPNPKLLSVCRRMFHVEQGRFQYAAGDSEAD